MVLLERGPPLALLAEYAAQAGRGEGRLVLVAGEAGVGKSTVVERLAMGLTQARWFWGACDGLFTPRPLGAFLDVASQIGGSLASLFKSPASRDELFTALASELGAPGGLRVVVIEDIHWADEATLDLLRFLGRRIRQMPVLIVATYRDDELAASYPLRVALGELAVQRCTRRIELPPLSREAVATMAAGSGLDAGELHQVTHGNPFYVLEVLQTGLDRVPQAARDAVLARAVQLGSRARNVLHAAALIGGVIEPSLLERVTAASPEIVDELVDCGLLVADNAALRFRHEIARRAVQLAIPEHRQSAIHARILAALLEHGCDDHARLAFHAEAAGNGAAALRHATLAGRRAAELGAHREAAAQFERALRFAQSESPEALAARYDALAAELQVIDSFEASADAYQRALRLWREVGDRLREGDTLRKLSIALWRLCRGREAVAASAAALQILEPLGPSAELARAYARVAADRAGELRWDETSGLARQAEQIAGPLDAHDVQSNAVNLQATVEWARGGDWKTLYLQALTIALEHGEALEAGHAYTNLHEAHFYTARYAESEPYYLTGVEYCEEHDLGTYLCCLQGVRAVTLERQGRWDESVALSGVVLRRVLASPVNRMIPVGSIGRIRARRGEPGAWEFLDQAMTSADGTGDPLYIVPARLSRAEAHWLEGNRAAAHHEAGLAEQAADGAGPWLLGEAAAWVRRTGPSRRPRGELAEPYRLQLDGDWQNAAKLWDELGCPYDAAMALLDAAEEPALRRALDICQGLGATATARVVRRAMRQLGIRSIPVGQRSATRRHPLGLTRRESEVLALVCAGHTNAEIAGKLFISTKTAGHHVSAVLAKLGAPTREAAASEASRLGLAVPPELYEAPSIWAHGS
jgi:DNA-binding CsgD family transcriptional regulator